MRKPTPTYRPSEPRRTPYQVGRLLGQQGSLKGLPYGPGWRQDEALRGFQDVQDTFIEREAA